MIKITVKCPKVKDEKGEPTVCVVPYDIPETLAGCVKAFGENSCRALICRMISTDISNKTRAFMNNGSKPADIIAKFATWKPGVSLKVDVDPVQAVLLKFKGMNPEERAKLIGDLKAMATS